MVINTFEELIIDSEVVGTILKQQQMEHHVHLKIIREIDVHEYLKLLSESEFAWASPYFKWHKDLRYYEVEALPD